MRLFRLHNRWLRPLTLAATMTVAAAAIMATPSLPGCDSAHAADNLPSDYCYQTDIAITYSGAGTATNTPVRVELNALGLVGAGQVDARAWDIKPIIGSLSNEIHVMAQDLDQSDAAWWFVIPEISQNETRTIRMYSKSGEQRRDNGLNFNANAVVTVADDPALDISDNLRVDIALLNYSDTARNEVIHDHYTASTAGWSISWFDNASALTLRATLESGLCDLAWDSAWTGATQDIRVEYIAAAGTDTFIYRNGSLETSCDIDRGTLAASANDLVIGDIALTETVIRDLKVYNGSTLELSVGFDASGTAETSAVDPDYAGTFTDYSSNGFTVTYAITEAQSDWSYTVGATQLVSGADQITLADSNPDVLGPAFNLETRPETTTGTFYTTFLDKWADAAPVRSFGYAMALAAIGLLMAVLTWRLTRYVPLSLFMFGIPFAMGVVNGWIPAWFMILWLFLALGGWFAQRNSETA